MKRLVIGLALVGTVLAVADYFDWRRSHRRLLTLADGSGLSHRRPGIDRDLRRETTPARAAGLLAWHLLDLEMDRDWLAEVPAAERRTETARGLERLRLAGRLATEVVPRSPASWRAYFVLGASRFLLAGREGRREGPPAAWRLPLLAAMRLAPSHPEPQLMLAAAELSRWSNLSPAEREEVLPVLRRALAQPRGLDLLLPAWIRVAPSLSRLLEPIPDRAPAWQRLAEEFRRGGDVERFAMAHRRWLDSLPGFFGERIAGARARLPSRARGPAYDLLQPIFAAPRDAALVDAFAAALSLLPDETARGRTGDQLQSWLSWALDLCGLGRCPLDDETLQLLAARVPNPSRVERALAALASNQPVAALQLEPAAGGGAEWNPYWLFKAQRLAGRDPEAARRALARVAGPGASGPRYWLAALAIAEAGGDAEAVDLARRSLARLARPIWPRQLWTAHGRSCRLEVVASAPAEGLSIEVDATEAAGAAVELRWDGRLIDVAALLPRTPRRLPLAVEPGVHLVEVTTLDGRPRCPLSLRLAAAPPID